MDRKIICRPIGLTVIGKSDVWCKSNCSMRIISESGIDDGVYYPAQDVYMHGVDQVKALRDLCDETLKLMEPIK